jgi:hypothetical protein
LKIPNFIVDVKKLQVIGNFNPIKMNFLSLANLKLHDISQDPKQNKITKQFFFNLLQIFFASTKV